MQTLMESGIQQTGADGYGQLLNRIPESRGQPLQRENKTVVEGEGISIWKQQPAGGRKPCFAPACRRRSSSGNRNAEIPWRVDVRRGLGGGGGLTFYPEQYCHCHRTRMVGLSLCSWVAVSEEVLAGTKP